MKNLLRICALCLFAISCVATPGCGEAETAAPTTSSTSEDGAETADGSDTKTEETEGSDSK